MGKGGRLPAESFVESQMLWCGNEPFLGRVSHEMLFSL